jgi:mevalonate kinase
MSQLRLSLPSKTFLLGEYLALSKGPSLVVATEPRFEFKFRVGDFLKTIHAQSPAGLFYQKCQKDVGPMQMEMTKPANILGGFGASTAQYIALWLYSKAVKKKQPLDMNAQFVEECWQDYRELFPQAPPSGADLINQLCGGLTIWDPQKKDVQKMDWPFADLKLYLLKTSHKIKTHEHLAAMDPSTIPTDALSEIMKNALQAFKEKNSVQFLRQTIAYTEALYRAGLQSPETMALISKIATRPNVLCARGCGALGADVIAVYGLPGTEIDFSDLSLTPVAVVPENISSGPLWRWS